MQIKIIVRRLATAAVFASISLTLSIGLAHADTVNNVAVGGVGVQGRQLCVIIDRDFAGSCNGRIAYLSFDGGNVDQVMSLLVSARLNGTHLARMDYHFDGICRIDLVQL